MKIRAADMGIDISSDHFFRPSNRETGEEK